MTTTAHAVNPSRDLATIALRELRVVASIVDDLGMADFARPTALPGWTVEDLVRHVGSVALRQGEAFHRARLTVTEAPTDATVTAPLDHLPATFRAVVIRCADGVECLGEISADQATDEADRTDQATDRATDRATDQVMVPLPYATLPTPIADYVLLVEYGIHRYDLERAVTGTGVLAGDVGDTMADLAGLTLPALASPDEPPAATIRLEPHDRSPTTLAWRSGRWSTTDEPEPTCVVRGPAEALALFMTGRITVADDRLTADDPTGALARFKTMFPGP